MALPCRSKPACRPTLAQHWQVRPNRKSALSLVPAQCAPAPSPVRSISPAARVVVPLLSRVVNRAARAANVAVNAAVINAAPVVILAKVTIKVKVKVKV